MSPPDHTIHEEFEQLCHEVSNPHMVASGHAHLLERYVLGLTSIAGVEREQLMMNLASIKGNVQAAVLLMEEERWRIAGDCDFGLRSSRER